MCPTILGLQRLPQRAILPPTKLTSSDPGSLPPRLLSDHARDWRSPRNAPHQVPRAACARHRRSDVPPVATAAGSARPILQAMRKAFPALEPTRQSTYFAETRHLRRDAIRLRSKSTNTIASSF